MTSSRRNEYKRPERVYRCIKCGTSLCKVISLYERELEEADFERLHEIALDEAMGIGQE